VTGDSIPYTTGEANLGPGTASGREERASDGMPAREARLEALGRFLVPPAILPPLDRAFRPAVLARRALRRAAGAAGEAVTASLAVEMPGRSVCRTETAVFAEDHPDVEASYVLAERLVKTMLWSRGGSRVWVDGPDGLVSSLRRHYAEDAAGRFDSHVVGETVCGTPIEVISAPAAVFPAVAERPSRLGGHMAGCRIGFDLGASDRKAAAVIDGEVVFSEEILWDPSRRADPQWHFDQIMESLRNAAAHLPRVDAIGGSAAGIYVDSEVKVASLFRSVPPELFRTRVGGIFEELRRAWGGIPFVVVNDGEVTALAGAMVAGVGGLLGVAMGSSEAAGFVTRQGGLTPWLNELAFTPVDLRPDAPIDEWSGDRGCGVQYLSQQAAGRLLSAAGIEADPSSTLPQRLVLLQKLMAESDERARLVYETIGTYLGYALLDYLDWYDFEHLLLLGRVTSGPGGDVIEARAGQVLATEAPENKVRFHHVSERDKRHGQAVAAASLPSLGD
jgi:predicted NBD/HSP70 family sugar kinase